MIFVLSKATSSIFFLPKRNKCDNSTQNKHNEPKYIERNGHDVFMDHQSAMLFNCSRSQNKHGCRRRPCMRPSDDFLDFSLISKRLEL